MAEPITLDEAKMHLRVLGTEEDPLIQAYLSAARNHCENELGVKITDAGVVAPSGEVLPLPDMVKSAILVMTGFLFENRDADARELPRAVAQMLNLSPIRYRKGIA